MFKTKKIELAKQQIEQERQQIEQERQRLEQEKQELLFIKEQLEDASPKVDISNVYVFENKGIYNLVQLCIENIQGRTFYGLGPLTNGYKSTITDIFTNEIIFERSSVNPIKSKVGIDGYTLEDCYDAYLYPIYEVEKNLLAYVDKKVPLYVLQQLYYNLNKVNINAPVLKMCPHLK